MISLSGDFQLNPEHKDKPSSTFSIFHWNLNSITAHNYAKVLFLEAYIAVHKFDIVCMSQTYLDSNNAYDDGNLEIEGYNLINIGPSIEYKRGAVCIYYKNFSPLRVLSNHYLQEYINIELKIGDKFCNFIYLNRSPSQTQDEFKNISENFENNLNDLLQNNPFLVEIIGYFNVKSKHWYCHDKSCLEGDAVDNIAKQYVLHQIIRKPTHILDSSSSCTDLVFYFLA